MQKDTDPVSSPSLDICFEGSRANPHQGVSMCPCVCVTGQEWSERPDQGHLWFGGAASKVEFAHGPSWASWATGYGKQATDLPLVFTFFPQKQRDFTSMFHK